MIKACLFDDCLYQSPLKTSTDNMMWFLVFLLSVLVYYSIKIWRVQTLWKRKGIAYDVPVPFFGMMLDVIIGRKSFFECMDEIYRAHQNARYVGFYQFTTPNLLLKDPELIKQIHIKEFDSFSEHTDIIPQGVEPLWSQNLVGSKFNKWKGLRPTLTPAFTSSKMKLMFNIMEDCSQKFASYFVNQQSTTVDVELKDIFTRFTNDVIASATFGVQVDSLQDQNNEFYLKGKAIASFINGTALYKIFFYNVFTTPMKLLNIKVFPKDASAYFNKFFKQAVQYREQNNVKRPDMINLLLEARNKEEENGKNKKLDVTDEEIAAQAIIFFLGGFETVATSLCFTVYELAVHQDIQERLRQEVDEVWNETKGKPSFEDISKMKYLDMVISENLRKNPPMIIVDRQAVRPFTIDPINEKEKPLKLETGDRCTYSVCSLHWDEKYFPNAKEFDPERFSDANKHKIIPGTYLPFGTGPRACIGARFATLEMKSLLFHLTKNFEFIPNKKTEIPIELAKDSFTLAPKNGFHLSFKKREVN